MLNTFRLNKDEQMVYRQIHKAGFESPVRLQCRYGWSRQKVYTIIDVLHRAGLVSKPQQGLFVSRKWIEENPEKVAIMNRALKMTVV